MKKFVVTLVLLLAGTPAMAQHIGPASTTARDLKPIVGVGYDYYQAEWEGVDVKENRPYVQVGVGGGMADEARYELYLRLGAADLTINDHGGNKFNGNFQPFAGGGVKINFLRSDIPWGLGLVAQGAYFGMWDDEVNGVKVKIRNAWEVEGAIPLEYKFKPFTVYAGPVFFHEQAQGTAGALGVVVKDNHITEDNDFGAFGGIAVQFGDMRLEAEVQQKSDTSFGGLLTYSY
ncbi:MAG TPA: hypothetical protein VJ955_03900 [Desulfuromonadales bacterium]|nr:hypothetical protein [Desulfuromonadales bacterium]